MKALLKWTISCLTACAVRVTRRGRSQAQREGRSRGENDADSFMSVPVELPRASPKINGGVD